MCLRARICLRHGKKPFTRIMLIVQNKIQKWLCWHYPKLCQNQNPIVLLCWERSRRAPAPQALEIHRFRWPKLDALRLHCWQPVIPIFLCESLWHEKIGKEFRVASQHILKVPLVDFEKYGDFQLSKSVGKEPISISWKLKGQVWKNTIFCFELVQIPSSYHC